jgi:DNA-directed RNA polymerase specialized sigma24 family protein
MPRHGESHEPFLRLIKGELWLAAWFEVAMVLLSEMLAPFVPPLRRFARAITGSQEQGDDWVQACLECLLHEPERITQDADPRAALYALFLSLSPSPIREKAPFGALPRLGFAHHLDALNPAPRLAFLLRSVEGFSIAQSARILACSDSDVERLLQLAGQELADQIRTDVLIIEDEPFIALDLQRLVEELGHRVIDIARTRHEAVATMDAFQPGLILADIQLADGSSGLAAVNDILAHDEVPVIFITAYPERFLTGHRPEPAFLIPKPFSADMVQAMISQALFFERRSRRAQSLNVQA